MKKLMLVAFALIVASSVLAKEKPVPADKRIDKTTKAEKELIKGELASKSQTKYAWRICHSDGILCIVPFWANGSTWTKFDIEECPTLDNMKNELNKLALSITTNQQAEIDALEPVPEQ